MTTRRFALASDRDIEIGHVDDACGFKPMLARGLGDVAGELLGIAGFAREQDGQRLGRPRRRRRLRPRRPTHRRRRGSPRARRAASALAGPTTRLRSAISSSENGAVFGMAAKGEDIRAPVAGRSHVIETYSAKLQ